MSSTGRLGWRVHEIVIVSVVAVACAVIFSVWNTVVWPIEEAVFGAAPAFGALLHGAWMIAGVLGGYLIRKPGAALYCELLAAIISAFLPNGSEWGLSVVVSGLIQGLGAEIGFALFAYRGWNLLSASLAGALASLFGGLNEVLLHSAAKYAFDAKVIYLVTGCISGVVLAGVTSWALARALAATGVLSSLASGAQARSRA